MDKVFLCSVCGHKAPNRKALNRHKKTHTKTNLKKCPYCPFEARSDSVKRHERSMHKKPIVVQASSPSNVPAPLQPVSTAPATEPPAEPMDIDMEQPLTTVQLIEPPTEPMDIDMEQPLSTVELIAENSMANDAAEPEPMEVDAEEQPVSTVELIEEEQNSIDNDQAEPMDVDSQQPMSTVELNEEEEEESTDDFKPEDYYTNKEAKDIYSQKYKTMQSDYEFKIKPLPIVGWQLKLMRILLHMLSFVLSKAPANARGRLVVEFDGLSHAINERVCEIKDIDLKKLLERIESVLNSNESADISDGIRVNFIYTKMPSGQGTRSIGAPGPFQGRSVIDPDDWSGKKSCLLNAAAGARDNLCMARCLVTAMGMVNHNTLRDVDNSPIKLKALKNGSRTLQTRKAHKLHKDAGIIPIPNQCGLVELRKFQDFLTEYQIILYEAGMLEPIYKGPEHKPMQLYLWLSNNHYQVINPRRIAGLFAKQHYCPKCHEAYNRTHQCGAAECRLCKNPICDNRSKEREPRICDDCDLEYLSPGCFAVHKLKECHNYAQCPNCRKRVKRTELDPTGYKPDINEPQPTDSLHNCLQNFCRYCNQHYMAGFHTHCHVQKPKNKKSQQEIDEEEEAENPIYALLGDRDMDRGYEDGPDGDDGDGTCREARDVEEEKETRYIFADFETERIGSLNEPILLCLQEADGTKLEPYVGPDCAERFVKDCFIQPQQEEDEEDEEGGRPAKRRKKDVVDKGFSNCTFVFHNFAGFDGQLVLREIHKLKIKPKTLFRGSKLLSLNLPQRKIRFLDSYLHCVMPLSAMPKAYGFPDLAKGHFPYALATKEQRHYRGRFPDIDMFDVDHMTSKQRQEVIRWHTETKKEYDADPTKVYDLQLENLRYCQNDVDILRQGVLKYRECMMSLFNQEDPLKYVTLPSYCNAVFRKDMMDEDTIAIVAPHGYGSVNASAKGLAWLEYQSQQLGLYIHHGRNSHEVTIGKYKVDGFARTKTPPGSSVVFEYNGCFWHGHSCQDRRKKTSRGESMDELHAGTMEKAAFIRSAGFQLVSVYECEVDAMKKQDRKLGQTLRDLERRLNKEDFPPLNPRDAFKGGRTNALRKTYTPKEGETLKYFDVNSLYPSINFSMQDQEWPIGHPEIQLGDFPKLDEIFGLVKCTVQPPDQLYLPALGMAANNKLIFGLCGTCINEPNVQEHCTHTDKERRISGTFVSEELKLAVSKGYKVVDIQEVWKWPKEKRSKTLFRPFISAAYREKTEASGWPAHIKELIERNDPQAEELKEQYMDELKEQLGIEIRPEMVEYNPTRRQAAKLLLNNFWGFWGKDPNPDTTEYIETVARLYSLLSTKDVGKHFPANDEQMVVCYKDPKTLEKPDPKANVVLAAFTTAYARMRLYHFMDMVGDRCCYIDTDSVIWIDRVGEPVIETGNLLGEMKDEILDEYGSEATIGAYAGLGAKTYSLMISDRRTGEVKDWKRKMKGIRATFQVDQLVPGEKLLDMVRNEYSIKVPQRNLRRNRKDTTLEWVEMDKVIKSTFSKRLPPPTDDDEAPTDPIGSRAIQ